MVYAAYMLNTDLSTVATRISKRNVAASPNALSEKKKLGRQYILD